MEKKEFHKLYNDLDINKGKDKKFVKKEADIFYGEGKRLIGCGVVDSIREFMFKYLSKFLKYVATNALDNVRAEKRARPNRTYNF